MIGRFFKKEFQKTATTKDNRKVIVDGALKRLNQEIVGEASSKDLGKVLAKGVASEIKKNLKK